MVRVSSFGQQQALLQSLLRNQQRLFVDQQQISTGKKATEFRQLAGSVQDALAARQVRDSVATFRATIADVRRTVDTYDLQLTRMVDSANALKTEILSSLGDGDPAALEATLEQTFSTFVSALNSRVGGAFIFGGARTDLPPVGITDLSDLADPALAADAFANDDQVASAFIAEGERIEFGRLADDVAGDMFESFKRLVDFQAGPDGPLGRPLTAVQREFLEAEFARIDGAISKVVEAQIGNGIISNRLSVTDEMHADSEVFLETLVSEIEDVNMAEAITRFEQDQIALEASFQAMGSLQRLTLLDFI